ncbi:MAG: TetR family transcriptional regulator C-terminal domain-containing protein [Oscillospiraceae bacterium]|nr:TetR family transcriptional regulator C-terminal domain-containing protein [Oscillospiraceae bacterium]
MQKGEEPTVIKLCSYAGINRSTFYRHHPDVLDLMDKTEKEIQIGLLNSFCYKDEFFERLENPSEVLEPLIAYIGSNKLFYREYLKKHAGIPTEEGFQKWWDTSIKPMFIGHGISDEEHMRYYFEYVRSGFASVVELWLENGCKETPSELAELISRMLPQR